MSSVQENCPDCGGEMHRIKLIDATDPGAPGEGIGHVELAYAAPEATASAFTRTVTKSGSVGARLCPQCGRITLHASQPGLLPNT